MPIRNDPAARFPKQAVRSSPCVMKPLTHLPGRCLINVSALSEARFHEEAELGRACSTRVR